MIENITNIYKVILSLPYDDNKFTKANIKKISIKGKELYQLEKFTKTQAFHQNIDIDMLDSILTSSLDNEFKDIQVFTNDFIFGFRKTSKGKILTNKNKNKENTFVTVEHNRKKKYILEEGIVVPPLVDLGIMTSDGLIVKSHYDKYKQINRFLEIIDDVLKDNKETSINIIDFGCGKSYLTFIVYYYFKFIKNIDVSMIGLDLKQDVIKKCNEIKDKYGYDKLSFEIGDISLYKPKNKVDMIITLHACDTATDFAMYHAIKLNVKYLLSVPCCQHEINLKLNKREYAIMTSYGIIKERFSALLTDSIRAKLLEYYGYKTQILEFVDFDSSPKNLLIRAIKTPNYKNEEALIEVKQAIEEYKISQTLYNLLNQE